MYVCMYVCMYVVVYVMQAFIVWIWYKYVCKCVNVICAYMFVFIYNCMYDTIYFNILLTMEVMYVCNHVMYVMYLCIGM